MKQFLSSLALVAVLVCVMAASALAQANLGNNFSTVKALQFSRTAPTTASASMTYQDTITFAASTADTVRTNDINTDLWDWSGQNVNIPGTAAPHAVAEVVFWVPYTSAAACVGDSILWAIEPSFDGGVTFQTNGLTLALNAIGATALGTFAITGVSTAYPDLSAASAPHSCVYRGWLVANPVTSMIAGTTANYNIWGLRDFRLKLFGDGSGVIGQVRGAIFPISSKAVR